MKSSRSKHYFSPDCAEDPADGDVVQVDLESLFQSLKKALENPRSGSEPSPKHSASLSASPAVTALPALEHEYLIYLSDNGAASHSKGPSVQMIKSLLDTHSIAKFSLVDLSVKPTISYAEKAKCVLYASYETGPMLVVPDLFDPSLNPDQESISLSPLAAALKLQNDGRARVEGMLSARTCQDHNVEPGLVALNLNITISLLVPAIFSPLYNVGSLVSKSQLRILSLLFPRSPHDLQQAEHVLTSTEFYAALKPAPALSDELATQMQPEGLPFQKRSVAWLLQREGHGAGPDTSDAEKLPLCWAAVEPLDTNGVPGENAQVHNQAANNTGAWYYNSLLGELRCEIPNEVPPMGGMLCEEMGLGKTVECIAMILHHRALATPSLKPSWWDDQMSVEVTPVNASPNKFMFFSERCC
jgi:hypothetical protein